MTVRAETPGLVLAASGLGKAFGSSRSRIRPLLQSVWRGPAALRAERVGVWALREVSFELARGQSLGVIGRNGSGKSTLLRLLSGTARPTAGRVDVRARLGCLLELGTGFHALETGRQNAEAWLVLLGGRSRREARREAAAIERFADIGTFFDRPLRTCSTGMQLRVAFATAAQLEPEILVTDEVLAVGDESFQLRCNRYFDRFLERGGSLVLCAHDLYQVQRLCENTLWLDRGRVRELGETRAVVRRYREEVGSAPEGAGEVGEADAGARHRAGEVTGLPFEVVDLRLQDEAGAPIDAIDPGATVVVVADLLAPGGRPEVHISFTRDDGTPVYGVSSDMDGAHPRDLGEARYRYVLTFPELPLVPGGYIVKAHALDETATRLYDTVELRLRVRGEAGAEPGLVRLPISWQ